ncbi:MAG: response regulator [Notoacmeibacter sp.]|nr:response regulator [Notoacmeibacter sp.]
MKRCMIVDDSAVIRKVAKRILNSDMLHILEAGSGGAALAECRAEMPDYLILDGNLEDMKPLEFLTALKTVRTGRLPLVFLLVTELDIGPIMRAKRAGAAGYLLKPFERHSLTGAFADQVMKAERARIQAAA